MGSSSSRCANFLVCKKDTKPIKYRTEDEPLERNNNPNPFDDGSIFPITQKARPSPYDHRSSIGDWGQGSTQNIYGKSNLSKNSYKANSLLANSSKEEI